MTTTSGTYTFNLTSGGCLLEAFDRIGTRPVEITREQMTSAVRSFNLELSLWNSNPVNLWAIELVQISLVAGTATYALDAKYQLVTDAYVSLVQSGQDPIDRILISISRDTYSAYPDKVSQGPPSVYWFQRLATPQITVWPVPDGTTETYLYVYAMRRVQDVTGKATETVDVPYRFLEPVIAKLAARLALKYNPEKFALLKQEAKEAYDTAFIEDQERAGIIIMPDFSYVDPFR